jgi:hypothetical protein
VRSLRDINFFADGWHTPFLDQLIRIYLVLEGFTHKENLSAELQDELKTIVGFTQNQDELKNEAGISDQWCVLAKRSDKEENLTTERNWLYGIQSKKYALILQFYVKGQLPEVNLVPGSCIDGELVFFKGANPIRALIKQHTVTSQQPVQGFPTWNEVLHSTSDAYAINPWMNYHPVIVENVVPLKNSNQWILKDTEGGGVSISHQYNQVWKLMSISGGKPVRLFALGREHSFEPIGAWVNNQYVLLS